MNKMDIGKILLKSFENTTLESKSIFQKIIKTLFEPNVGLLARRNITIGLKTNIMKKNKEILDTVENIINNESNSESSTYTFGKSDNKSKGYMFEIGSLDIYIMLDVNKRDFFNKKIEDKYKNDLIDYENKNLIVISLIELNKTQKEIPIYYYYKDLLFNLTKNKYVPHIEIVDGKNISAFSEKDLEDNNLPKIKRSDKLIKFYSFPRSSICKITYKTNKIKDIDLYCNYRIVI